MGALHRALHRLPVVQAGRWAVSGSAALALHGFPVDPRDLDLVADTAAANEFVDQLGDLMATDEVPWDRGDVRAARRAVAVVEDVDVEILVDVEVIAHGARVLGPPKLDHLDHIVVGDRLIPVLPLSTMLTILDATGKKERAEMVRDAMSD